MKIPIKKIYKTARSEKPFGLATCFFIAFAWRGV